MYLLRLAIQSLANRRFSALLTVIAIALGYLVGSGRVGPLAWRRRASRMRSLIQAEATARIALRDGDGAMRVLAADMGLTTQEARAWCESWLHATRPLNAASAPYPG